jgi:hypothetical protein
MSRWFARKEADEFLQIRFFLGIKDNKHTSIIYMRGGEGGRGGQNWICL